MESVLLKIRITTDDEGNVEELCKKLEGLTEFKALLPKNPTDLEIREFILNYYHKHKKTL